MLHEIFPHRFSNQFLSDIKFGDEDYILHYSDNKVLLKTVGDGLAIPRRKEFPELTGKTEATFLFKLNDIPCWLIHDVLKTENPEFICKELSFFRYTPQQEIAWISMAGYHLMNWYRQNHYCGICGSARQEKTSERALFCPKCQHTVYPQIAPAIIVAIVSGDRILLARNSSFPGSWYSLIAGYVDVGESLEETVRREVKEEVGLEVKNIRYYKSQPWPLSGSMMIGFVAEADPSQPIVVDENEIAEAAWFTRGNLPPHSLNRSIAGEMIERFDKGELSWGA